MKHYELVLVMDASTSMDEVKKARAEIEPMISHCIDTDDMGMVPLATKLNGHASAYFLSYHIQATTAELEAIKQHVRITRSIVKCRIFAMHATEPFMKYADVKKSYEFLADRDIPKKVVRGSSVKKEVEVMEETAEVVENTEVAETSVE